MTTERYRRVRRLTWLMGVAFFAHLLMAQRPTPASYPISEQSIASALEANGIKVHPSAVHVPVPLRAATESPSLEIVSAERMGNSRTRIELRCHYSGECTPFFVTLDLAESGAAFPIGALQAPTLNPVARSGDGSDPLGPEGTGGPIGGRDARMQAGSRVTIVLANQQMVIQLPGIAMDAGTPGADVRICTLDRKTVFHARVVDSVVARGTVR